MQIVNATESLNCCNNCIIALMPILPSMLSLWLRGFYPFLEKYSLQNCSWCKRSSSSAKIVKGFNIRLLTGALFHSKIIFIVFWKLSCKDKVFYPDKFWVKHIKCSLARKAINPVGKAFTDVCSDGCTSGKFLNFPWLCVTSNFPSDVSCLPLNFDFCFDLLNK